MPYFTLLNSRKKETNPMIQAILSQDYAQANFNYRCCVNLLLQREEILLMEFAYPIAFNIWSWLPRL
jgi:hypothetical protein